VNNSIDLSRDVSWCMEFDDGTRWFDKSNRQGEVSEWLRAKKYVEEKGALIKRLYLFSSSNVTGDTSFNGAMTEDEFPSHFFFANKSIGGMGMPTSNHYAIGWKRENKMIIVWYDQHMSCYNREERDVDESSPFVIRNGPHERIKRI
jgi:hypothetical protein